MGQTIGNLTATDRLRTGTTLEIQDPTTGSDNDTADDLLTGVPMDSASQIIDYNNTDTMEVEAATLAARFRLSVDETNYPQAGWNVSRFLYADSNFNYSSPGATAVVDINHTFFSWFCTSGICVLKKVTGFQVSGGTTGTPVAGATNMKLSRTYGLGLTGLSITNLQFPPGINNTFTGTTGLKMNQAPGQAFISIPGTFAQTLQGYVDPNPIGLCIGNAKTTTGQTNIFNGVLYDYQTAEHPLILTPGTGVVMSHSHPAASSVITMFAYCNWAWDEWTLLSPNDR